MHHNLNHILYGFIEHIGHNLSKPIALFIILITATPIIKHVRKHKHYKLHRLIALYLSATIPSMIYGNVDYALLLIILINLVLQQSIKRPNKQYSKIYNLIPDIMSFVLPASAIMALTVALSVIWILSDGSLIFFSSYNFFDFITGTVWNIDGNDMEFGILPLLKGSLMISIIALCFALPFGVIIALYITFYASDKTGYVINFLLEIMGGLPSVVHGFFGTTVITAAFNGLAGIININAAHENAMITGLTVGVMLLPTISILTVSALTRRRKGVFKASIALGATKSETIKRIILPATAWDISNAALLALSRSIGETTIIAMLSGNIPGMTMNPLKPTATITTQIMALLRSDQEFNGTQTMAAYALGLILITATLTANYYVYKTARRYNKRQE